MIASLLIIAALAAEPVTALSREAGGIVPERDLRETIERIFVRRGGVLMPELRDDASPALAGIRRRLLSAAGDGST